MLTTVSRMMTPTVCGSDAFHVQSVVSSIHFGCDLKDYIHVIISAFGAANGEGGTFTESKKGKSMKTKIIIVVVIYLFSSSIVLSITNKTK